MIGQTIAHYRVTAKLGAGGMGEVYRATDSKLGRDVALKVLPEVFAQDAQRMARFQREAQVLAALNHPNIAAIYGLEDGTGGDAGVTALVMELVEGPTLAERIARGPIALEEALVLAGQMVDALEAAHEKGIIHRDLKPANVKVSLEGKVKVLDFGLAKAMDEGDKENDIAASPTLSMAATRAGIILGTAAYMSPEQARGSAVDRRADIWSFGVVFFEMLTGKQLFSGDSVSDTLAAVLRDEIPLDTLPASTPHHIRKLLRRCLERDRKRRLRDIGEARLAIEEYLASPADASVLMSAVSAPAPPKWRRALPWALAGAMTVAFATTLVLLLRSPAPPAAEVSRFEIDLGPGAFQGGRAGSRVTISPDGRKVVFVVQRPGAQTLQFYLRRMDSLEIVALPGTEDGHQPFFSPDSQWLGFSGDNKLKKVPLAGGLPVTLCDTPNAGGGNPASWADNGSIFFSHEGKLKRIPEGGGVPEIIAEPDQSKGERFQWVATLPGSRAVLLVVTGGNQFMIDLVVLETRQRQRLVEGGSWPRYLASGHILYAQHSPGGDGGGFTGGLLVVPFDLQKLERTGSPVPVMDEVYSGSGGAGFFDVSAEGTLVFRAGVPQQRVRHLAWLDQTGKTEELSAPPRPYFTPAVSPDSTRVAVAVGGAPQDIHVYDVKRGTLQRITYQGTSSWPVFTPDGSRVIYTSSTTSDPGGGSSLWWTAADGSGTPERLTTSDLRHTPHSVSPDGKLLAFTERRPETATDILVMPLEGDRTPRVFLKTQFSEVGPRFSPDGKWIAYASNESGRSEVYVQAYPGPGGKMPISVTGGDQPQWSRDGKQLFYYFDSAIMVVDVATQPTFRAGQPRVIGERLRIADRANRNWFVAANGRILIAPRPEIEVGEGTSLRVVQNFLTEVRRRQPANK